MTILIPFFLAATLPVTGCQAIETESVVARDVAALIPAFAQLPADFLLGYVPSTGAQRLFRGDELERIAKNRGLDLHNLDDVCFERRMFIPDATQIRAAMEKTLGVDVLKADAVKIEILSSTQRAVPVGELIFPRTGVQISSNLEVNWQGYVRAGETARFPVSARARITTPMNRVVAATDLQSGKLIDKSQLRLETIDDSPFDESTIRTIDEAVGMLAKSTILNSMPIRKTQIERPMDVARGALVRVDVFEGAAHLTLEARAETAGMKGSFITVRNLSSGREFRAEVAGKDHVILGNNTEGNIQ
jgi:flagella basal body P-ring formation protein FlgA